MVMSQVKYLLSGTWFSPTPLRLNKLWALMPPGWGSGIFDLRHSSKYHWVLSVTIDPESKSDLGFWSLISMLISGQGATAFSRMSNLSKELMLLLVTVWRRQSISSLEYFVFGINLYEFFMSFTGPVVEPLVPAQPIFLIVFGALVGAFLTLDWYDPEVWHSCPISAPGSCSSYRFLLHLTNPSLPLVGLGGNSFPKNGLLSWALSNVLLDGWPCGLFWPPKRFAV